MQKIFNIVFGGDERVRTSAPLSGPNCLANSPLHHLGKSPGAGGENRTRIASLEDWDSNH